MLAGYLRTMCRNLVVDAYRGRRGVLRSKTRGAQSNDPGQTGRQGGSGAEAWSAMDVADLPAKDIAGDWGDALDGCIRRLPEPDRSVVVLRYRVNLPTGEIAELFERTPRWSQGVLKRAREALAVCLQGGGYDVRA